MKKTNVSNQNQCTPQTTNKQSNQIFKKKVVPISSLKTHPLVLQKEVMVSLSYELHICEHLFSILEQNLILN